MTEKTKDDRRDIYLQRNYRLSLRDWEDILLNQGGGCAGCGSVGLTRSLHTDHNHRTKVVRGILCASCNSALRKLKDNPDIADSLAEYLRNPPAVRVLGEGRLADVKPRKRKRRGVVGRKPRGKGRAQPKDDSRGS